jgi:hypothetical protein
MIEFAIAEHDSGHFCLTQENVDHSVNCVIQIYRFQVVRRAASLPPSSGPLGHLPPEGEGVASLVGVAPAGFQTAIGADQTLIRRASPDTFSLREKGGVGHERAVDVAAIAPIRLN